MMPVSKITLKIALLAPYPELSGSNELKERSSFPSIFLSINGYLLSRNETVCMWLLHLLFLYKKPLTMGTDNVLY